MLNGMRSSCFSRKSVGSKRDNYYCKLKHCSNFFSLRSDPTVYETISMRNFSGYCGRKKYELLGIPICQCDAIISRFTMF